MDQVASRPFSAAGFRIRAAREAGPYHGADYGDHRLNPSLTDLIVRDGLRDAAVLIPVVDRGAEATVLLTQRTEKLRSHSGQVAFPGGRIDPTDASVEEAALRETAEEIGLPAAAIEVVGRMPDYVTGSGYRIAPVLGIVTPPFDLVVNEHEVDAVFEVPLGFLMTAENHVRESRLWQERERFYYTMPYQGRFIWGVTAGIIRTLYERLYA
jgi:8-oxo-dGTP pyrophosphatase MutT (NUDIX family)